MSFPRIQNRKLEAEANLEHVLRVAKFLVMGVIHIRFAIYCNPYTLSLVLITAS